MNDKQIFYKDKKGQIKYNELCVECPYECKQSFHSEIITCKYKKELKANKEGK